MNMRDVKRFIKKQGWTASIQVRGSHKKKYIYAKKQVDKKGYSRYICTETKLTDMTEEQITAKLTL